MKQNNLIFKDSYLIECAITNEENNGGIEECNIFTIDHSRRGNAKCGSARKPSLRMNFASENQVFFKSKHILRYFRVGCAFGSFRKGQIAKNIENDMSKLITYI